MWHVAESTKLNRNEVNNKTYYYTPLNEVLLEKLTGFQLVKNFPAFYGTRRFITTITSACCPYLHIPLPEDPF